MSNPVNTYRDASDWIIKYFSKKGYSIDVYTIINSENFQPTVCYKYGDLVVKHEVGITSKFGFSMDYWVKEIDSILLPIKREMKLDDLGI